MHYSVILASFRRNGGETEFTKIITPENSNDFKEPLALMEADERPLVCYKKDELHWLLLTDRRVLQQDGDILTILLLSEMKDIQLSIEVKRALIRKEKKFTLLEVAMDSGEKIILKAEPGPPYVNMLYAISNACYRGGRQK